MIDKTILKLIRLYQQTSFFHNFIFKSLFMSDQVCRFNPTCSVYTYQAVKKYGSVRGLFLGLKRILRCHPWNKGGFDPLR